MDSSQRQEALIDLWRIILANHDHMASSTRWERVTLKPTSETICLVQDFGAPTYNVVVVAHDGIVVQIVQNWAITPKPK